MKSEKNNSNSTSLDFFSLVPVIFHSMIVEPTKLKCFIHVNDHVPLTRDLVCKNIFFLYGMSNGVNKKGKQLSESLWDLVGGYHIREMLE